MVKLVHQLLALTVNLLVLDCSIASRVKSSLFFDEDRLRATEKTVKHTYLAGLWYEIARSSNKIEEKCMCPELFIGENYLKPQSTQATFICGELENKVKENITVKLAPNKINPKSYYLQRESVNHSLKIIDIDDKNHLWFVMGDVYFKHFWIFSAAPQLEDSLFNEIIQHINQIGYDTKNLILRVEKCSTKGSKKHPPLKSSLNATEVAKKKAENVNLHNKREYQAQKISTMLGLFDARQLKPLAETVKKSAGYIPKEDSVKRTKSNAVINLENIKSQITGLFKP